MNDDISRDPVLTKKNWNAGGHGEQGLGGPGAKPLVKGSGGQSPLKLKTFWNADNTFSPKNMTKIQRYETQKNGVKLNINCMKLHTTITMRIVCAIFDYSSYLPIGVGAQSTWGTTGQAILPENICMKINKIPKFYIFARKVFFLIFLVGVPPFPMPMYFLSSTSVKCQKSFLTKVKLRENLAHVTVL